MRALHSIAPRLLLTLLAPLAASTLPASTPAPTFAEHIAPLIHHHCTTCHHPDGPAPFSLINYTDVSRRARQIAEVTASGFMPPWKPDRSHTPPLRDTRGLSSAELATLQRWLALPALPLGDPSKLPPAPTYSDGWSLGPPDLILELPAAYTLPAEGRDLYHNFVLPVPLRETRYVRAVEFQPRPRRVIHHATVLLDTTGTARRRDSETPREPGFPGMELGAAASPDGHFIGWAPGQTPYQAHPGTAWKLSPGTDLVLQTHLVPSGKPELITPRIGLYFTDTPPTRIATILQLRSLQIDIPAGQPDYVIEKHLDLPAPVGHF